MNQTEYEKKIQGDPNRQDLWQDYVDGLDEEKKPESGISDQVEKDLINYSIQQETGGRRRRQRAAKRRSVAPVAIILMIMAMIMSISLVIFRASVSYDEPEYYPPIEEEYYPEEEYYFTQDLGVPEYRLNGSTHPLPENLGALLDEGWEIRSGAFSSVPDEVGSDPVAIRLTRYGDTGPEVLVASPSGEPVALRDATVIGISMKEGDYYDFYIPGDISFFSSSWSVEYSLEDSDVTWTKTGTNGEVYYNIHKHLDDGSPYHEYDIDLRMEDDMVTEITMRLSE